MGFFSSPAETACANARARDTATTALTNGSRTGEDDAKTAKKVTKRDRVSEGKRLPGRGKRR